MFFLFGHPRSGTTLLAQCLNNHPDIVIPFETEFLLPMAFVYDRIKCPDVGKPILVQLILESGEFNRHIGEYLDAQRVRDLVASSEYSLAAILEAVYDAVAGAAGAKLAGDKTPNDIKFAGILEKAGVLHGGVPIIHLVRDVRDVLVSLKRASWAAQPERIFPRNWCAANLYLHERFSGEAGRYLCLRYEDFVRAPEAAVCSVANILGVDYRPEMLDTRRFHPRYQDYPHLRGIYEPIHAESVGVYRTELSVADQEACIRQAREAMEEFGYL